MSASRPLNHTLLTLILGTLTAFAPFATDTYLSSLPAIAATFHASPEAVQLSLSTFFLGLAVGQLMYGPLIDRFGRRRPLLIGIAIYTLACGLAIFAPTIVTFNALRFLQALGGAAGMIISRAIIRDLFEEKEAARALSSMMMVQGVGPIAAPILGGFIVTFAPWEAIFVFLLAFGALCFAATFAGLPETLPPAKRQHTKPKRLLKIFASLFSRRRFLVPTLASAFALAAMFAFISGSPFVFMQLFGVSPQHYGWLFGLNAFGMIVSSQINRLLLKRFAPRQIFIGSIVFNVCCGALLVAVPAGSSLVLLILPLFLCLATVPLIGANGIALAMTASGIYAGSASSIIGVLQFVLASVASALVGLLHDGTALPMSAVIFASGLTAAITLAFGRKHLRKTVLATSLSSPSLSG